VGRAYVHTYLIAINRRRRSPIDNRKRATLNVESARVTAVARPVYYCHLAAAGAEKAAQSGKGNICSEIPWRSGRRIERHPVDGETGLTASVQKPQAELDHIPV